ncbi:hypothetical protein B0H19DRAFT_1085671 [Mycena capillaripes]|nr:hypothetical protein B0H19DRAFT_1085671 [Mycena capillaripes]
MAQPFNDYPAGPSCSDSAYWHYHQTMAYDYQSPYDIYSSGARAPTLGESGSTSGFSDSATFSPSYEYADSPDMFSYDEFESSTPLSPSGSASSSCSSCSDAPITPYDQTTGGGLPLPPVGLLYTKLDAPVGGEYHDSVPPVASPYAYEGWDEDATQTYHTAVMPESSMRSSAARTEYDSAAALWACETAIAQFQYFDASPTSGLAADRPTYATYPSSDLSAVTSSADSSPHAPEYPSSYPQISCLSPALLSCPPPIKLHQPQPRRSIPVISLSALASASSEDVSQASLRLERPTASPALSPLELQFPPSHDARMTSYSALSSSADPLPIVYPPRCVCPECTHPYSIS